MFTKMGLHIIQNPAGGYSFVGSVPMVLAYRNRIDNTPLSEDMANKVSQFGPGLFRQTVKSVSYPTREEALEAATQAGYTVID